MSTETTKVTFEWLNRTANTAMLAVLLFFGQQWWGEYKELKRDVAQLKTTVEIHSRQLSQNKTP